MAGPSSAADFAQTDAGSPLRQREAGPLHLGGGGFGAQLGALDELLDGGFHAAQHVGRRGHAHSRIGVG